MATEVAFEGGQLEPSQIRDRVHIEALQLFFRDIAHSRQAPDSEWQQKHVHLFGLYHKKSTWFLPVRRKDWTSIFRHILQSLRVGPTKTNC
jgi:hypothetical protein